MNGGFHNILDNLDIGGSDLPAYMPTEICAPSLHEGFFVGLSHVERVMVLVSLTGTTMPREDAHSASGDKNSGLWTKVSSAFAQKVLISINIDNVKRLKVNIHCILIQVSLI